MAKSFLNLRPGVDFPEDGTDVLPYIQALERKCMELEDGKSALEDRVIELEDGKSALADRVAALEAVVNDTVTHGNLKLDERVTALEA